MAIRSLRALIAHEPNSTRLTRSPLIAASCLGLLLAGLSGCSVTNGICRSLDQSDCIDEFMVSYRNRAMAEKAWHCQKHLFGKRCHANEFKDGFIAGYLDVAAGGPGCTPAIAPPEYWGWKYQSAQGHAAVNTWFEGFPMGVRAAEQDGIGNWQQIRVFDPGVPVSGELSPAIPWSVPGPMVPSPSPYYGDHVPAEEGTLEIGLNPDSLDAPIDPDSIDPVFSEYPIDAEIAEGEVQVELDSAQDGLVSRFEIASLPSDESGSDDGALEITAPFQMSDAAQSSDASDLDAFSGPASDELPFSFE